MRHERPLKIVSAVVITLLVAVVIYGEYRLAHTHPDSYVTVSVVQPDVGQEDKWVPSKREPIVRSQMEMTRQVFSAKPDLIVWPETSFPGLIWESPELFESIKAFAAETRYPLLVGAITDDGEHYFNSAILIGANGLVREQYDKIHLVPFGEYIPFRKFVPFLEEYIPIADFTSGEEYTVFQVPGPPSHPGPRFSVLICFEDTLGYLARRFVREGAQFLVNMTNDGWFGASKEPLLHLQASVFRTVENRRALVRAANTGVSGVIDLTGRVQKKIADDEGRTVKVRGVMTAAVPVSSLSTFYTKWGDFFTYLCFACILGIILATIFFKKTGPDHVRD
jgi:apolipoprotein N-acyltransferase